MAEPSTALGAPPQSVPEPLAEHSLHSGSGTVFQGTCRNLEAYSISAGIEFERGETPASEVNSELGPISKVLTSIQVKAYYWMKAWNASDSEERNTSSTDIQGVHSTHRLTESKALAHPTKIDLIRKDLTKKTQRWKVENPSEPIIHMDTHNFSSESKQETEYGPCRIEMESILNNLKILNILSPRGVRIPNCDKKGFYKKKQAEKEATAGVWTNMATHCLAMMEKEKGRHTVIIWRTSEGELAAPKDSLKCVRETDPSETFGDAGIQYSQREL
ncbi:UNVERIFIED_CONTAM: hypothetical protein FKN15_067073 [Acipenser sinensis]